MEPPHVIAFCLLMTFAIIVAIMKSGCFDLKRYFKATKGASMANTLQEAVGLATNEGFVLECHVHQPSGPEEKSWYCNDDEQELPFDLAVRDVRVFELKGGGGGRLKDEHPVSECKVLITFDPASEGGESGAPGVPGVPDPGPPPLHKPAAVEGVGGDIGDLGEDGAEEGGGCASGKRLQQPPVHMVTGSAFGEEEEEEE